MSGALRKIGKVVGTVASIAALIPGPHQPFAAAIATVSNVALAATASGPTAKGQVSDRIIGANNPQPYLIGRSYSGGVQVHDVGYGGTVKDVKNPYRFIAAVYSCCGPVEGLESVQFDYQTVNFSGTAATGYYADYFWRDFQLGARPEADELQPEWAGAPRWGSTYKLSGYAAIGYSLKWSKKAKRFAGGQIPIIGAVWQGVKVYDPRLDSTYPGGSGTHRITDESTWTYSRNPALHALAYAYGRYVNGVKVMGVDLGANGVDIAKVVSWANVCDANSWNVDGVIYEPADKWNNLKRICEAGGGRPFLSNGILQFDYQAPRTSLATVTRDDLADGTVSGKLGKGFRNRINTLVPRFRSEAHQWNYIQADELQVAAWVTEDGEEKVDERQWDLVTGINQVTELASYDLYQRREDGPFALTCKPHMRDYGPGDCLTLDEELGVHPDGEIKAIIRTRNIDPMTGLVSFEMEQETDAKHIGSLGLTGGTGATIILPSFDEIDAIHGDNAEGNVYIADVAPFLIYTDTAGETSTTLPIYRAIKLFVGDYQATEDATWSITATTAGITASIDAATGLLTLSVADVSGTIDIKASYEGVDYVKTAVVNRQASTGITGGGPGSSQFTDTEWTNISTTSDVQVTDTDAIVSANASGELRYSASASYSGSGTAIVKAQYSTDGSTWSDFAAESTGLPAIDGGTPEPGYVSITAATFTGLTASADYYVRLIARRSAGTGTLSWFSPNFTVKQP